MSSNNSNPNEEEESILTIKAMEEAVLQIFQSSFDQDSKTCLVTLMKVLDNVLHKPADARVRTIRLSNAAFCQKVASRAGGVEFLLACGFVRQAAPAPLGSPDGAVGEETLVLLPQHEKQSRLMTGRRLLRRRAIEDLHVKEEELPPLRQPPKLVTNDNRNNSSNARNTFDPYVGHRYDAQSAAVGVNLGPDTNYVSSTNRQLQVLQQKQAKLERKAAQQFQGNRDWKAWAAGETVRLTESAASSSASLTNAAPPSDAALLAQRAKAQQVARQQREQGGLTTAAMRQVAALKTKKVYSHVQITIQFADQSKVTGKFLPKETIATVVQALQQDCFLEPNRQLDLYVAPPRRLLPRQATLEQEGLVPAAKMFASWKVDSAPAAGQAFLQPHLFDRSHDAAASSFPAAQPIVAPAPAAAAASSSEAVPKPKKKKQSREELMLQRMMGGRK